MKKKGESLVIGKKTKNLKTLARSHGKIFHGVGFCFLACVFATVVQSGVPKQTSLEQQKRVDLGRILAISSQKGNCIACHSIPNDKEVITLANIGPPLVAVKQRFPSRKALVNQIWDPTLLNPNSVMPPFGKHKILSEADIQLIVDYLYSLEVKPE